MLEHRPKVSIVTVVRNAAQTIEHCLMSVIDQTYPNVEHIVIDGESTDGTSEIIESYLSHIAHYERRADEGLYHAMNRGIQLATGDYVLLLNADDEYLPNAVQDLVDYKEATDCDVVGAQVLDIRQDGSLKSQSWYRQYNATTLLGMVFSHNVMLVPTALYRQLGLHDDTLKVQADWEFTNRLWLSGVTCSIMRKPLMRMRDSGVSNTDWTNRVRDVRTLLRRNFPFLSSTTLDEISDPRRWDTAMCAALVSSYENQPEFCRTVIDYGIRRGLVTHEDFDIRRFLAPPMPHLSVVIPAFNAEHTLASAIKSVIAIPDFRVEIICVDDGSTDGTKDVIATFAAQHESVRAVYQGTNSGVAKARNAGISNATGHYISFLDADDEVDPDGVAQALEKAFSNAADIAIGSYTIRQSNGRSTPFSKPPGGNELHGYRFKEIASHFRPETYLASVSPRMAGEGFCGCLYRRDIARNVRFSEQYNYGEDSLFLLHALCFAKRISWVQDNLYTQNIGDVSAMSRWSKKRVFDTIAWRMSANTILRGHHLDDLAAFVAGDYWAPDLSQTVEEIDLSPRDQSELEALCTRFQGKTGFKVPISAPATMAGSKSMLATPASSNKPLRVNVVVGIDSGGAAIGSGRRIQALRDIDVDARMYTAIKNLKSAEVIELEGPPGKRQKFRDEIMNGIARTKNCSASELFSGVGSVADLSQNPDVLDCDIIHLHWITGLFGVDNFAALANKPVAWTFADINALTGGCHYSEGCTQFTNACQSCHFFEEGESLPNQAWATKRKLYSQVKNLSIVCPSQWMAEQVKKSALLGDRPVHVIPNAMPVDTFVPRNKLVSKLKLGLPIDRPVILFGAQNTQNRRKGGDILLGALDILKARSTRDMFIGLFGEQKLNTPYASKSFGSVSDFEELSHIYSAADLFILPSREDNAPLTVAESLLCGTPVVSTPVGNVPELVRPGENGYVTDDFSSESLARSIEQTLDRFWTGQSAPSQQMRVRRFARQFHDPRQSAERHVALYQSMLEAQKR